jgi:MFS family permease
MDDLQWGLVAGLLCIGGLVGAFVGGFACRKIGRKTTQIYMNGFFLLGGMCMALSWSPAMLMVSRFILGIGW